MMSRAHCTVLRASRSGLAAAALVVIAAAAAVFLFSCDVAAQQSANDVVTHTSAASLSELTNDNLDRVAASTAQIAEILNANPGLFVELKRWVAKDASDHGQIVEDGDLEDTAINARLAQDQKFRAVATRLLQEYGYLLPQANPSSDVGRERDALVQARLRRLLGAQPASHAAANCGSVSNCADRESDMRGEVHPGVASGREELPRTQGQDLFLLNPGFGNELENGSGNGIENGPLNGMEGGESARPILRTSGTGDLTSGSLQGRATGTNLLPIAADQQEMAQIMALDGGVNGGLNGGLNGNLSGGQRSAPFDNFGNGDTVSGPRAAPSRTLPASSGFASWPPAPVTANGFESEVAAETGPPSMAPRRSPYSDIPSVYDMFLQATAPQGAPLRRFGADVFQNFRNAPQSGGGAGIIPIDFPASSDYVIGPGDGLTIDLWGGVSQRLSRTVDQEGRVSLPEVGPVLVNGQSLGGVQQVVQRLLRTQFHDVSADVSLSRLRTVRVYVVGDVLHPGAYDVSSLSTPLNALLAAGDRRPRDRCGW